MSSTLRTLGVALRAVLLATLVLGLGYPAVILGVGQLALPAQAQGSLLTDPGTGAALGSRLLGQDFADAAGAPLPGWFQGRPSAAGDGYDGRASSGSNLGPEHPELIAQVTERRALLARANGVAPAEIPADALTASASGLDPHISPAFAEQQIDRVARERGLPAAEVRDLVAAHTAGRDLGILGEPRVNVLALNAALAAGDTPDAP